MLKSESIYEIKEGEFWKDILYEILSTMDPWDIDIVKLAKEYSAKIESLKNLNFKIPANALIVCAVLLRIKADMLMFEENKSNNNEILENDIESTYENFEEKLNFNFSLIPKRVLKRKISAEELINAINEALKFEKKEIKKTKKNERQIIEINPSEDIRKSIEEIYKKIINFLNKNKEVKFSQISNKENLVRNFISLLFLSNEGKIFLKQNELYGEIFILPGNAAEVI